MGNVTQSIDTVKHTIDYTLGAGVITAPVWVQWLQVASSLAAFVAAFGGVILVTIRIAIAWRDWRRGEVVQDE